VAAMVLAVLLVPRGSFRNDLPLHIWTRRYAVALVAHYIWNAVAHPWLFAAWPGGYFGMSYRCLNVDCLKAAAWMSSRCIALHLTFLRLRIVDDPEAARRAQGLLK
jgi:hypothetical protein